MELSYLETVRLLGLDIALLVIIVLFALSALTARIAFDPAEPVGRWLLARLRARRLRSAPNESSELPGAVAEPGAAMPAAPCAEQAPATAEWLERLLRREPQQQAPPSMSPATQRSVQSEAEVA
jgi:hypothetical protein